MTDLPPPLVGADVDVRSFPFMPLHIHRLRTSRAWMRCKRNPALGFYLINLWTAAWQSKPAGSLEDDPMVLADAAMCSDEAFTELREDMLQGWIKCDDGRWYHPVVVEQALIAWASKCSRQAQTEAARQAREAKRRAETISVTENATTSVTDSNRHRHGHRHVRDRSSSLCSEDRSPALPADRSQEPAAKRSRPSSKPRKHAYPADAFATWYARFPRKQARPAAEKAFRKIEAADETPFLELLDGIDRFWRVQPDLGYWPHPASWLNGKRWLDEPASSTATTTARSGDEPRIDFGGGVSWGRSVVRKQVERWQSDPTSWPEGTLGPPPNAPGCKVPTELLRAA